MSKWNLQHSHTREANSWLPHFLSCERIHPFSLCVVWILLHAVPCSCLCRLMDVCLVNALAVSVSCVQAVICACDYKLVVTCWIFWQVVGCNWLFIANVPYGFAHYHVRQTLHILSCTRCYCRWCMQIFLQVSCVLDIFVDDTSYTGCCRRFRLTYRLILREKELHFNIGVYNPSKELTFSFNLLLHTYFKVPDVRRCQITGLHGCTFIDKVTQWILHCGCC